MKSQLVELYDEIDRLKRKVRCLMNTPSSSITSVENYSSLPNAEDSIDTFIFAKNSQGTKWLPGGLGGTFYSKGLYYSNGVEWIFGGDIPYQATQSEVNAGVIGDKFLTPNTFESASKWSTKANVSHTHTKSDITDFSHSHDWSEVTGKPTTFTPSAHTHTESDITDLDKYTQLEVDTLLSDKQDSLVSSVNIKTINSNSILGPGNLVIDTSSNIDGGSASTIGIYMGIDGGYA